MNLTYRIDNNWSLRNLWNLWFICWVDEEKAVSNIRAQCSSGTTALPPKIEVVHGMPLCLRVPSGWGTFPETNSKRPWKSMVGRWFISCLGPCIFLRGELAVSFREGNTYETDKTRTYQQKRPTRVHPLNRWPGPKGGMDSDSMMLHHFSVKYRKIKHILRWRLARINH